ncbi:hypothetical protein GLW08_04930 [Pontibacillus yanchengensis]|nr:DUF5301 domain-containing protein [Pontibacillus yanchengensis]MYL52678.1 hypothetical protein [Pontibacillus yanchengensis]
MACFLIIGCQSSNLKSAEEVTNIEVIEWDGQKRIASIDDKQFIQKIVKALDHAQKESTANMDFKQPDYKLHFNHKEKALFTMGYYKEVIVLNNKVRYFDYQEGELYNVEIPFLKEAYTQ